MKFQERILTCVVYVGHLRRYRFV